MLSARPSPQLLTAGPRGRRHESLPTIPSVCGLSSEPRPLSWSPGTPHSSWTMFCCQQLNGVYQGLDGVCKPLMRDPAVWGILGPPTRHRETVLQALPCPKLSPPWALPLTSSMQPTWVASSQRWILSKSASRAHPAPPGQGCGGRGSNRGGACSSLHLSSVCLGAEHAWPRSVAVRLGFHPLLPGGDTQEFWREQLVFHPEMFILACPAAWALLLCTQGRPSQVTHCEASRAYSC